MEQEKQLRNEEKVYHPSHYTYLKELCGVEVIDIVRHFDFDTGNALKYIFRCGRKNEMGYDDIEKAIEDIDKAIFYLNDKKHTLEKQKPFLVDKENER